MGDLSFHTYIFFSIWNLYRTILYFQYFATKRLVIQTSILITFTRPLFTLIAWNCRFSCPQLLQSFSLVWVSLLLLHTWHYMAQNGRTMKREIWKPAINILKEMAPEKGEYLT